VKTVTDIKRHAWMIIAHNNFEQLKILLNFLDYSINDIYLHIDKKVKNAPNFSGCLKKGRLIVVQKPINVMWGGSSQIACEILLLNIATSDRHHSYYHLLSGVDMPVKTWNQILHFFEKHEGKEFISFENLFPEEHFKYRVGVYHPFLNICGGRDRIFILRLIRFFNTMVVKTENFLGIKRKGYEDIQWKMGANWFSITEELAMYVLSRKEWIKKNFRFSICADEIFLQTLIADSDYMNNVYIDKTGAYSNLRYVRWKEGTPYIFKEKDLEELLDIGEDKLFARKFDWKIDDKIISLLMEKVMQNS